MLVNTNKEIMPDRPKDPRKTSKLTKRQMEDKRSTLTKQADKAIQMLSDTLDKKIDPTKAQMDACKLVLAKTMPDLKSIEQTNKQEQRSPSEIIQLLKQWAQNNPDQARELLDPKVVTNINKPVDNGSETQTETKH